MSVKFVLTRERGLEVFAPKNFNLSDPSTSDRMKYQAIRNDLVRRAHNLRGGLLTVGSHLPLTSNENSIMSKSNLAVVPLPAFDCGENVSYNTPPQNAMRSTLLDSHNAIPFVRKSTDPAITKLACVR
jgi:hypothetical protein